MPRCRRPSAEMPLDITAAVTVPHHGGVGVRYPYLPLAVSVLSSG